MGSVNRVALSGLKPGDYRLQIKGSNPDGIWNESAVEIAVHVDTPIWRTGWFAALALLFLASGFAAVARMWLKLRSSFSVVGDRADQLIAGYGLTGREEEILRLVLQGASNKDIQKKLFISASTVRNHVSNIYRKLGVKNRLDLLNRIVKDAPKKT